MFLLLLKHSHLNPASGRGRLIRPLFGQKSGLNFPWSSPREAGRLTIQITGQYKGGTSLLNREAHAALML
jgi:hypothetical protein